MKKRITGFSSTLHIATLFVLATTGSLVAAECEQTLLEAAPLGTPIHSAQVTINPQPSCEPVAKVVATLYAGQKKIADQEYFEDAIVSTVLEFPVRKHLRLPNIAGLYRIEWLTTFSGGATQAYTQNFTVPCPAPSGFKPLWSDADRLLVFTAPGSDSCEQDITVSLSMQDITGSSVIEGVTTQYRSVEGQPINVQLELPKVEGERRYIGNLTLKNASQKTATVPVEFVTGCGPIIPKVAIVDDRYIGSVQASECQLPIDMEIVVKHESGEVVQSVKALLKGNEFDFPLPEYEQWPAGDYVIESQFKGASGRARADNELTIQCTDPTFVKPSLVVNADGTRAEVEFSLDARNMCQGATQVTLQVRDLDKVVVFNRSVDLEPDNKNRAFKWHFIGVPGTTYDLGLQAAYGINKAQSVSENDRAVYECTPPSILNFGYSNPEATHLGGLVAMTNCNAPASAKIIVLNELGRVVADADAQLTQDEGTVYSRISEVSLGHLNSGTFKATLAITDNRRRSTTQEFEFFRDVDGPVISFSHNEERADGGAVVKLKSLSDLALAFTDASAALQPFHEYARSPDKIANKSQAVFSRIDGESTPQLWITGYIDLPADDAAWGFVGVLVKDAKGNQWLSPIARSYVPLARSELVGYHPSRNRVGFRSFARTQPLAQGKHELVGVVIADPAGDHVLIEGSGAFSVSSMSAQKTDAIIRQGVTEIPVALNWASDNTATLERITSVPDGDYTLAAIGRDIYGNASSVHTLVFSLEQKKKEATIHWPAVSGYTQTYTHQFRRKGSRSNGPLRILYRRVDGFGAIRINGNNVADQTSESALTPDEQGVFSIDIELVDSEVDARYVLHPDATDAQPLELTVKTYKPEFVTQRSRTDTQDTLSIKSPEQPCRPIVFDDLSRVSLRENETLCAVRLNFPGTSILSTAKNLTDVRLPRGINLDALYEEGFIQARNGKVVFIKTNQIEISKIEAFSATPHIDFAAASSWRSRRKEGSYITGVGDLDVGHIIVRAALGTPIVTVNGSLIDMSAGAIGTLRIPIETKLERLGDTKKVEVIAYYPDTPELVAREIFNVVAVPEHLYMESVEGQFVSPGDLSMTLKLRDEAGDYSLAKHGAYEISEARLISRKNTDQVLIEPKVSITEGGKLQVALGSLAPGKYRLQLGATSTHTLYGKHLAPLRSDTTFEIHDGSPIKAKLFTFRSTDKAPFFGQISIDYAQEQRRTDVEKIAWELSGNGKDFKPLHCCGSSMDFALSTAGLVYYRALITNRHTNVTSYTQPLKLNAFLSGNLSVTGPRKTFRGWPTTYHARGISKDQEVLWRVVSPNATNAVESRSSELTIQADETGTYYVEVIADTGANSPNAISALRTFFTVDVSWPKIPESVISGPTQVEYGKSYTFTVSHPPIFDDRGNSDVDRIGQWELPDGTQVDDEEWIQFALRELPEGFSSVNIMYHTWLKGDRATLTTAVHRIEPVSYRWPNWKLDIATNSLTPPSILRLSVAPEEWKDWMGLGSSPITTHWDLPSHIEVIERTPTEAIVYARDDRPFNVSARITDQRGNVTLLSEENVHPIKQIPFEISLRAVADRTLHTAPIDITAHVDPIVLPKGKVITRVAFYINGLYRGVTDGAPIDLEIRTPGEHKLRAIATIDNEFSSDDTVTLHIGENQRATCSISPIGSFRLNGLAKAHCDDPDGHMVEYRWYANGQLLSDTGTRVQINRSDMTWVTELSLVAVDNAGVEAVARYVPPIEE